MTMLLDAMHPLMKVKEFTSVQFTVIQLIPMMLILKRLNETLEKTQFP